MTNLLNLILLFILTISQWKVLCFTDFTIEKFETFNPLSTVPIQNGIKVKRVGRQSIQFDGFVNLTDDASKYEIELQVEYSALGNNQYVRSPAKIPRKPVCDIINNEYRNRAMNILAPYSTFPCTDDKDVDLCSLFKIGQYELRNFPGDLSAIPKYAATGKYRIKYFLYKKDGTEVINGIECIATLS